MGLNVVFCWSDISGYMAACWRALAALPDINLFVVAFQAKTETAFSEQLMKGIPCHLLTLQEREDFNFVQQLVTRQHPDIIVVSGWFHRPYRKLVFAQPLKSVPCVMGMDTPWWGTWKQHLAFYLLWPYLRRMAQVVVTGERSWQYAWRLGVPSERIQKGLYGIDFNALSSLWAERQPIWPKSFLFVGRYVETKGLDLLVQAYQSYRQITEQPWPLICCGQGPLSSLLKDQPGITDLGFIQPDKLPTLLKEAGVLVLPSRFDPWPLALVEAAASGLPIICTDVCGSAVEVIRSGYNGRIIPSDNAASLANALLAVEQIYPALPTWGKRCQQLAAPFSAQTWAECWREMCFDVVQSSAH